MSRKDVLLSLTPSDQDIIRQSGRLPQILQRPQIPAGTDSQIQLLSDEMRIQAVLAVTQPDIPGLAAAAAGIFKTANAGLGAAVAAVRELLNRDSGAQVIGMIGDGDLASRFQRSTHETLTPLAPKDKDGNPALVIKRSTLTSIDDNLPTRARVTSGGGRVDWQPVSVRLKTRQAAAATLGKQSDYDGSSMHSGAGVAEIHGAPGMVASGSTMVSIGQGGGLSVVINGTSISRE